MFAHVELDRGHPHKPLPINTPHQSFAILLSHTALASSDMLRQSKRKRVEDLDREEFTASFLCNLIRQVAGQGVANLSWIWCGMNI
jgi:hypothetical protein